MPIWRLRRVDNIFAPYLQPRFRLTFPWIRSTQRPTLPHRCRAATLLCRESVRRLSRDAGAVPGRWRAFFDTLTQAPAPWDTHPQGGWRPVEPARSKARIAAGADHEQPRASDRKIDPLGLMQRAAACDPAYVGRAMPAWTPSSLPAAATNGSRRATCAGSETARAGLPAIGAGLPRPTAMSACGCRIVPAQACSSASRG